ncbi:MAG: hypothetical protein D6681_03155 [Calditrichaeota bacterium]|nr:MAG: hypothetical protein D6681_03155 [Calditrichota bacterium]
MRGELCILAAILFLGGVSVWGQDWATIYEDYLPEAVRSDEKLRSEAGRMIGTYGEYAPEIIYFYLQHLQYRYEQHITDPQANLARLLAVMFRNAKVEKSDWAKREIENCRANGYPARIIEEYFSQYVYRGADVRQYLELPADFQVDENRKYFFVYLYLSQAEGERYDPAVNYQQKCREAAEKIVEELNFYAANFKQYSREENLEVVQKALRYPYLLKNSYFKGVFPRKTAQYLSDFIAAMEKHFEELAKKEPKYAPSRRHNKFQIDALIAANPFDYSISHSVVYDDPLVHDFVHDYSVSVHTDLNWLVGVHLKIRPLYGPLSYINLWAVLPVGESIEDDLETVQIFDGLRVIPGLRFQGNYRLEARNLQVKSSRFQFSVPLYAFRDLVFVEVGAMYRTRQVSFEYEIIKEGEILFIDTLAVPDFNLDREFHRFEDSEKKFSPVVGIAVFPVPFASLRMEYLWEDQRLRMAAGLHLRLF